MPIDTQNTITVIRVQMNKIKYPAYQDDMEEL